MTNIMDDIQKRTQLSKPPPCKFRPKNPNKPQITVKPRHKNRNLYADDEDEYSNDDSVLNGDSPLDEHELRAKLYETLGNKTLTEEEAWRRRSEAFYESQKKNEHKISEECHKETDEENVIKVDEGEKKYERTPYKNNPLMKNLLNKFLETQPRSQEFLKKADENHKKSPMKVSQNHKNMNSNELFHEGSEGILLQDPEDPDFYRLCDTATERPDFVDDGFRFAHYGYKEVITPRSYATNFKDEQFQFKKKSASN